MKKIILSGLLVFCVFCNIAWSQSCGLYTFKEGMVWQLDDFNEKGKSIGHTVITLTGVSVADSVFKGQLHRINYDEKNKQAAAADINLKCEKGDFYADMVSVVSEKQLNSYRNGQFKIQSQDMLLYPAVMQPGLKLPNGRLSGKVETDEATNVAHADYEASERMVLAKESLTVPAGTFTCYKISSKVHVTTVIAGVKLNIEYVLVEWYAAGMGMVRSEIYKKGKLETYSVLAKVN